MLEGVSAEGFACECKDGGIDELEKEGDEVENKGDVEIVIKQFGVRKEKGDEGERDEGKDLDEEVGS